MDKARSTILESLKISKFSNKMYSKPHAQHQLQMFIKTLNEFQQVKDMML